MIGNSRIDGRYPGNVNHYNLGAVGTDAAQQLFGQLARALSIDLSNDRKDQKAFAHRQNRSGEFPDSVLLLTNDPFALLDESRSHGHDNSSGGRFVSIEHAADQSRVRLIFLEQRSQ